MCVKVEFNARFRVIVDVLGHFGSQARAHRKAIWPYHKAGIDLWFIQHDLYRMPGNVIPAGRNDLEEDAKTIVDVRLDSKHYKNSELQPERLVFAKLSPGRAIPYTFIGKYKYAGVDEGHHQATWVRTSKSFVEDSN